MPMGRLPLCKVDPTTGPPLLTVGNTDRGVPAVPLPTRGETSRGLAAGAFTVMTAGTVVMQLVPLQSWTVKG